MSISHPSTAKRPPQIRLLPTPPEREPAVDRHPTLAVLEDALQHVTWERAASAADDTGGPAAIVALPTVLWLPGPDDHPKSRHGLLPYPLTWQRPFVLRLGAGEEVELPWIARAWGQRISGAVVVRIGTMIGATRAATIISADRLVGHALDASATTLHVHADVLGASAYRRALKRLVDDATSARWTIHQLLEPWLRRSLESAHRAVSGELRLARVVDALTLDDLLTEVHLGTGDRPGLVDKVINRLATPGIQRPNVDAGRYIVTTFRRDAELALRRRIDDPRWVGPSLRRFAANHPELSVVELVEAYNRSSCLSERIGLDRAMRALHPAVQPYAVHVPLELIASRPEHDPRDDVLVPIESVASSGRRSGAVDDRSLDAVPA